MYVTTIGEILTHPIPERNSWIPHFSVNSKEIRKGSLFFALEGNRVNGASFLSEVAQKGGRVAIVPQTYRGNSYGLQLFFVDNVVVALQKLAQAKMSTISSAHVIAITGSIGKTTSKEYLFALLRKYFSVFHTPKNYNSQVGLPLSLLNAASDHQIYIVEMGMSEKGNIQQLVQIAPPTIAWITQISHSHFSNFSSLEEIAREKAEVFSSPRLQRRIINENILRYKCMQSLDKNTIICGRDIELLSQGNSFQIRYYQELSQSFSLQTCGKHLLDNLVGAIAIAKLLGLSFQDIFASINTLPVVPHRFEKKSYKGITFIDDSYNANADSTIAALHNLPKTAGRRILVFTDMHELGSYTGKAHERVASAAVTLIDACFCLGEASKVITDQFISHGKPAYHYNDRELMFHSVTKYTKKSDVVLVKGANQYKLWEIIPKDQ